MNTGKLLDIKEKLDRSFALLHALAADSNQSSLVKMITLHAQEQVRQARCTITDSLNRRVK